MQAEKFNFAKDSVLFSAWLIPRAERWPRRQALRQTTFISTPLEQFNLLLIDIQNIV